MSINIESHLIENRVFKPKKAFSKKAHISSLAEYQELYRKSIENPKKFWAQQASETSPVAEKVEDGSRVERTLRKVVRGRPIECLRKLHRPPSVRGRPGIKLH